MFSKSGKRQAILRCGALVIGGMLLVLQLPASARGQAYRNGELTLKVTDAASGDPIAVRMHIKDQRDKPVRRPGLTYWHDHFVFDGEITLDLRPGLYTFELERGPEYRVLYGNFQIAKDASDTKHLQMRRIADMASEGWWSGDLHIHRSLKEIELLMKAEDIHVAPVITWWNNENWWKDHAAPQDPLTRFDTNRYYHVMAGEDEREGGALLFFNLNRPLAIANAGRESPSPVEFLRQAHSNRSAHIDIEKPFWWDVPTWVATGMVDSIGLANNHLHRDGGLHTEAWGKPRDKLRFPGNHGNGRWSQHIYYELLNCGLRIPPSAGSASGVLANPVGYNRVYVHCGNNLTWAGWWEGLRQGRVIVTNGPLLRATAEGHLPGHVFTANAGEQLTLQMQANLALREKVEYLEVIQNGKVAHEVRLDEYAKAGGRLPPVLFRESGWFLLRAVTSAPQTYRFATTGPFYVEIGEERRISRSSAEFFLDWVKEREQSVKLDNGEQRDKVLSYHRDARTFWETLKSSANSR